MSHTAYSNVQIASESPLDLEVRAISHITSQLLAANEPDVERITRVRALNGNLKLWSLLMEYLSDPANALPDPLKASYISLGLFSHRTSVAALTSVSDLTPLIRINTDVLDALNHQRQASIAA